MYPNANISNNYLSVSSFKMSTLNVHAFPMHSHLHLKLHNSICAYPHWVLVYASARSGQELLCLFADPDFQEQHYLTQVGIPWSTVATPGFALVRVKM